VPYFFLKHSVVLTNKQAEQTMS